MNSAGGSVGFLAEVTLQNAPVALGRTTRAGRPITFRERGLLAEFRQLLGWREIFEVIRDELRPDAFVDQSHDLHGAGEHSGGDGQGDGQLLAGMNGARGFHWLSADADLARGAGFGGQASRFEKPDRPEPFIHPNVHLREARRDEHLVPQMAQMTQANQPRRRERGLNPAGADAGGSFDADIPECETWLRAGLGTEMSEADYRIGRAYTMINKYVSSAAHLKGKKLISCEELTNIHTVFNETPELMKIAGDQSIISGATHPVFHGFNYSPPEAPFPGWVIYGTFINERNPWWPYFKLFTSYKTRLSAVLQQATMFADIAILPALADLWSIYGAQNEPFPAVSHPAWQTLIWESIHQNGSACDYISEQVIKDAVCKNGYLHYGPRKYHSIFLTEVESMEPATAKKLFEFVLSGGRVFCIKAYPHKATGWMDHQQRDNEVQETVANMKNYPDRFILIKKPEKDFTHWYKSIQEEYKIAPYVNIHSPNPFITQVRYQAKDTEMILLINSNINDSYETTVAISKSIIAGKQAWIWDAESGERYQLTINANKITVDMGPADLKLLVFDRDKKGPSYEPGRQSNSHAPALTKTWSVTGHHIDGTLIKKEMEVLKDLKDIPEWIHFGGSIVYRANFVVNEKAKIEWLNLGKVFGVSELIINGENAGTRWYGRRIYPIGKFIKNGNNEIEVKVVTTLGNYLKSLKENRIGQYWTNEGRTIQPLQSMGLAGPVTVY